MKIWMFLLNEVGTVSVKTGASLGLNHGILHNDPNKWTDFCTLVLAQVLGFCPQQFPGI